MAARHDLRELARHVDYHLTATGESLHPLLAALRTWSVQHMPDVAQAKAVAGGV